MAWPCCLTFNRANICRCGRNQVFQNQFVLVNQKPTLVFRRNHIRGRIESPNPQSRRAALHPRARFRHFTRSPDARVNARATRHLLTSAMGPVQSGRSGQSARFLPQVLNLGLSHQLRDQVRGGSVWLSVSNVLK